MLPGNLVKLLSMNKYLEQCKAISNVKNNILAVMGNESVDLDSAVSSISLAFHLSKNSSRVIPKERRSESYQVVPVINCKKIELPLKTEVTHWLRKHQIDLENLVCKDEIDIDKNVKNFILVDHHVSPYHERVIAVIDHRPYDENSMLPEECSVNIQEVGSCATLITEVMKNDLGTSGLKNFKDTLQLLYGPIVVDTINFNRDADKVRELDIEMAELIEYILDLEDIEDGRKNIFEELVAARADISSLTALQILSKDLKIISNDNSSVRVAIPGVHVFEYTRMPDASESVQEFAERENIDVVLFNGLELKNDQVERQLGVVNIKNEALYKDILNTVRTMKDPDLELEYREDIQLLDGEFYLQGNIKASRKQILPVIKQLLTRY